ncbi:GNAT family N-acetyltransferase [Cytophagaceae bacterium ABcell3]|nr:GNAT family N-acetyltransferase [Cytophagaceae bacterium ABcell3]
MKIHFSDNKKVNRDQLLEIYKANKWSSAEKPDLLVKALLNSDALVTAWHEDKLIGLGNAISDGHLVVYYPHLLVHPNYQCKGIGKMIVEKLQEKYAGFHQQMLVSDAKATDFYIKCGFKPAGQAQAMWVYEGDDH